MELSHRPSRRASPQPFHPDGAFSIADGYTDPRRRSHRDKRQKGDPQTPDMHLNNSKRAFEGLVSQGGVSYNVRCVNTSVCVVVCGL